MTRPRPTDEVAAAVGSTPGLETITNAGPAGGSPPARHAAVEDLTAPTVVSAVRPAAPDDPGEAPARASGVQIGELVGRHLVLGELGRGGMGRVFLARDRELDRMVAIKFVTVVDATRIERFLAEARVTARCTHPNIVAVHEIGQHHDAPYLVLEHIAGESLAQLARRERLPVPRVLAIMTAVARALACAHSHGIVHRDLKPSNVVVRTDDTVKVLDFGIAAYAQGALADELPARGRPLAARRGEVAGTLRYMAPEQLRGEALDGRADLWAFGVMLFELLAGARPYDHLDDAGLRAELAELERPTPSIATHRADLPPGLARVVERCLEKPRARRYRSADELVAALQRLAGDHAACELPLWLTLAPSADEADRVALGLVRAVASRGVGAGLDPGRLRVWPDGRVEITATDAPTTADPPAPSDALRAIATYASQAIDCVGGTRTATERRRARRMNRVLAQALRPDPTGGLTLPRLARRLAAAHAPRTPRVALAGLAVVVLAGVTARLTIMGPAATVTPLLTTATAQLRLERLERELARLRAAGDGAAADALFERFVTQPESAALRAEAWLRRSARELAGRDLASALDSAATAYQFATDDPLAVRALTAIAVVQRARRKWTELANALDELGPSADPTVVDAAAALAIATRQPAAHQAPVRARWPAVGPALAGRPEVGLARAAVALDLDRDGRDEAIVLEGDRLRAVRPGQPPLWEHAWPASVASVRAARDDRGLWAAACTGPASGLLQLEPTGARTILAFGRSIACTFADLDGDGAVELYVAGRQELVRYRADPTGTWQATTLPIGSEINAVTAVDLDGDGRSELAVAAGEWQAYDVRIIAGAAMTMVDRLRLGRVSALAALARGPGRPQLLLARKDGHWPSAVFLPIGQPSGLPNGYYALTLDQGHLRVAGYHPDSMGSGVGTLAVADLDGDGRDEGLATERSAFAGLHRVSVVRVADDLGLTETTIEGVAVLATGRFGTGPGPSALAAVFDGTRARTWWLGLDETPVPPLPVPTAPRPAVPTSLEPAQRLAWRRAVTLGRVGATTSAVIAFEALAAVLPPSLQTAALLEVLALRRRQREPTWPVHEALAGRAPAGSAAELASLRAAASAALEDGALDEAIRLIDAALRSPSATAADRAELQATRATMAPALATLFDGGALGPVWQILDPVGVWRDAVTRTVVLDSFGVQPLIAVDLTRSHGPIQLVIEGTLTRAEWAAGLRFSLRPIAERDAPLEFAIRSVGGGGTYRLAAELDNVGSLVELGTPASIDTPVALQVRVTWLPDTGRQIWDFTADGVHARFVRRRRLDPAAPWVLEVAATALLAEGDATRSVFRLSRLALAGFKPSLPTSAAPLAAARRALANGDPTQARTWLTQVTDREAALVAAVLALRDRDRPTALAALRRWRGRDPLGPDAVRTLAHLARVDDGRYAEVALDAAGPAQIEVVALAWTTIARQHPDAELVQRELTQNLRRLDLRGPDPAAAEVLLLRARAHARIDEFADANADLDALLAPARRPTLPPALRADAYLARARVAAHLGDRTAAGRAILDALDASPWPDAVADLVLLDPRLAPLADAPGLERVRTLGRTLATPSFNP